MKNIGLRKDIWHGRSVFVTGHTGFKGAWLSLWLQRLGARVYGYAREPETTPSLYSLARVGDGMESTIADVRDGAALIRAMQAAQPEIVFHLAAQPMMRASYRDPATTYDVNVMGTVNFLEAVRRTQSVRAVVIVTSDKCYENQEWNWGYREYEPMGGRDPYSSSKGCAELVTSSYRRSFFSDGSVALASARAGNVIGGGDWAEDRLLPDLIRSFCGGRRVVLRNPETVRPWQHTLEPLRGYLMLAERLFTGGAEFARGWNFGPRDEDARPTLELVQRVCELWGKGAGWEVMEGAPQEEGKYLKLDCSRARSVLGWQPVLDLDIALQWTVAWYRANLEGGVDLRSLTLEQIKRYEKVVAGEELHAALQGTPSEVRGPLSLCSDVRERKVRPAAKVLYTSGRRTDDPVDAGSVRVRKGME